eukprot:6197781-Amphidinium_carterae.3
MSSSYAVKALLMHASYLFFISPVVSSSQRHAQEHEYALRYSMIYIQKVLPEQELITTSTASSAAVLDDNVAKKSYAEVSSIS